MANTAKKIEEFDEEENTIEKPAYIDWQEFNRISKSGNKVPNPEDDSRDDTGEDELDEVVMGKDYVEEDDAPESVLADVSSASRLSSNQLEDDSSDETAPSSDRPDPEEDLSRDVDAN